jgi:ribokinase
MVEPGLGAPGMVGPPGRGHVVVLGDVMIDVVARVDDPLALGSDTAARVHTRQGGAGANVAGRLARCGVSVTFLGCVGDDPFGREAVEALRRLGVRVEAAVCADAATGTVVVLVGADGERTMLPDAGANSRLSLPSGLLTEVVDGAAWLHASGYTLLNPGSRAAGVLALDHARGAGVLTSVDAASAAPLEALGGREFLRLTHDVDLALCTLDEAEVLVGTRDPAIALARLTATYRQVILKLGADGARWSSREDPTGVGVPAVAPSGPVIDSTGAGDAFAAAFLAARLAGTDVRPALTEACRAAADLVTTSDARNLPIPVPVPRTK